MFQIAIAGGGGCSDCRVVDEKGLAESDEVTRSIDRVCRRSTFAAGADAEAASVDTLRMSGNELA